MTEQTISSIIIPTTNAQLLLPNTAVATMISFVEPGPIKDAPNWILGSFIWQGWQVPLASWSQLLHLVDYEQLRNARIAVVKALESPKRMPYFGILAQGFPRLARVTPEVMEDLPASHTRLAEGHIAVLDELLLDGQQVMVPDLERMAQLVAHACYGALPGVAGLM